MRLSTNLQLLTCLIVYASSAHGIMVKFGTRDGPILPEVPRAAVAHARPSRTPAPVWEERSGDAPNPYANWRPEPFIPQPRYTQVIYNPPANQYNSAKHFVNAYLPYPKPIEVQPPKILFTPSQIVSQLSSQSVPGVGIRYFVPNFTHVQVNDRPIEKEENQNDVERNDVSEGNDDANREYNEAQWQREKESAKRTTRTTSEQVQDVPFVYQWPAYVPHRRH
ncbi:uncharacterized protein LOC105396081 [Plutella xylostella]|uniref:uncharacterized protein LOC105396081 n=1 Tax=Plutella xylostella TaxID=51655 RepID=UPI002032B13E|nr:uncharacterized protein LOC105396081 [Plutella xylostella]XP_048484895.1 uncharacterized protein LOC105396081 [Plutella xylostella]